MHSAIQYLIVLCCVIHINATDFTAKCCDKQSEVLETNHTLDCLEKTNFRLQVWSDSYDFLESNVDGECIDTNTKDCYVYRLNNSVIISKQLTQTVFRKCCPLEHVYNPLTHSCAKRSWNATEKDFMQHQCVKVGLPQCRTILDKTFKTYPEAKLRVGVLKPEDVCLDKDLNGDFVVRECQEGLEICEKRRCFKKCCPDGQSYVGGGYCRDTYLHGLKLEGQVYSSYIEDPEDEYALIYGTRCPNVSIMTANKIQYSIKKGGEFTFYHNYSGKFLEHNHSNFESYCLEHATKGKLAGYYIFWCQNQKALDDKFSNTLWAKLASCVFLLVTIIVYFYLGETRSTFGKILINYCVAMILLFITLLVAHLSRNPSRMECKIRAYLLIFFNMSAFASVNVMSVDIWCTFGTPTITIGSDQRKKDLKKFLLYLLYGWGMPLCHSLLILLFDSTSILPESIQPYVGIYVCFMENRNYARTVLFLIPQLIFQIINTVLFIKTIIYCIKVKNEISKMNDSNRTRASGKFTADKERLALIVKLAVIMGIIWIFEVTTAFFENMRNYSSFTKTLEIILDTITCLQGVFIFIIFICKKKTFNGIKSKLGLGERRISCSMSVTQSSQVHGHYPMNKRQTTLSINDSKI